MTMNSADGWSIVEPGFRAEHAKAWEGLFTLGSGYMHVRGSFEEHFADAPQNVSYTRLPANVTAESFRETKSKWGTYVPGVFGKHPLLNNEMINLPWFLGTVSIVDGERLDVEHGRIEDYRRTLHLDCAVLSRKLTWITRSGKRVHATFERFVDAVHPHICVQRIELTSSADADLVLQAGIDADVRTNGYDHLKDIAFTRHGPDGMMCRLRTDAGDAIEICSQLTGAEWTFESHHRAAALVGEFKLRSGQPFAVEKRTALVTSRDLHKTSAEDCLREIQGLDYPSLREAHATVWRERWEFCDVVIEGDPESQLAMRVALFHLLRAHVPDDVRVAIDAKGYAGEAYWGRYFWDTEMFLLPFFLYTDPQRARTLVDFRIQSLPGASANAQRYGYSGARYAWESDAQGLECCPNWQYADHEVHVTADVAYGLAHYARATGDPAFLRGPAAQLLVETARYWVERVDRRPDGSVALLGVMGPDEYTPISSNNAYTNAMVALALRLAAEYGRSAGASAAECAAFRTTADALPILRDEDGSLVLQCAEFELFAEPRFDALWKDRTRPFAAQVSQERLYRSKALKQADVLMLMMLLPQDFTDAEVRRAWDYYLPYTTHDSSLSAGGHAILACRLGLDDEAWQFWQKARAIDLDVAHGGAAEGIHIANAGAVWQMAVLGFAGMRTAMQSDVLTFEPRLPARWSRLAFPVAWKRGRLYVNCTRSSMTIRNDGPEPLPARVSGVERTIQPGQAAEWKLT